MTSLHVTTTLLVLLFLFEGSSLMRLPVNITFLGLSTFAEVVNGTTDKNPTKKEDERTMKMQVGSIKCKNKCTDDDWDWYDWFDDSDSDECQTECVFIFSGENKQDIHVSNTLFNVVEVADIYENNTQAVKKG